MASPAYTPSLPGLSGSDELDTVINWGLGADSTAYLARMLTDPAAFGIDLERTVVLYMATGSEWPETRLLVEEFMLPLLRERGVRFVQLARAGRARAAGITVLDDSRRPQKLFARGPWALWDEMESVGTVPQQAGVRKCSLRAKGEVGDRWITQVFGGRPFRQIMGFNADEEGRRFTDTVTSKIPGRTGVFPLIAWGRRQVEEYLLKRFGVHWPKSYCTFCCFPVSMGALPAHLERMRSHPGIAGEVLRLEYTAMSLNPNARLYGRRSLLELFDPAMPRDRACLEAFERELDMPWALYRVRRLFLLSGSGKRRPVMRSTERVDLGRPHQLAGRLISVSERHGVDVEHDPVYGCARVWLRPRGTAWLMAEELFTTAPAHVIDKQDDSFEYEWHALLSDATAQLPLA
jgi:3'-phosphoadenosine 5'-phosphosulfate sulfotransferase (PAPS reductase)/FAD synthetase